mmetsp:Transcript_20628/g.30606  ORF Transcript_20628/g.30606 Transcript_20628/m.30606 type:complete len:100 (-) Transcript_20628:261-560(-)
MQWRATHRSSNARIVSIMTRSTTRLIFGGSVVMAATAAAAELDVGLKLPDVNEHATIEGMTLKITNSEATKTIGKDKEISQESTEEDARELNAMAGNTS